MRNTPSVGAARSAAGPDPMCRYALIVLAVCLLVLMVASALIVQAFGWPGFLVLIAGLIALAYIARRSAPRFIRYLLTRPLKRMGAVLHGARITVHSVVASEPPTPDEYEAEPDCDDPDFENQEAIADTHHDESPFGTLDWYEVEFTVTPPDSGPGAGRIVHRRAWNPQLIGAVGPRPDRVFPNPTSGWPLPDQFAGFVQHSPAEVWDGDDYVPPGAEVFGEQRLRLRIGVGPDIRSVTVTYVHFTNIGQIQIPRIDLPTEPRP